MYIFNKVIEFKENSLKHHVDFQCNEWFFLYYFIMNNGV